MEGVGNLIGVKEVVSLLFVMMIKKNLGMSKIKSFFIRINARKNETSSKR